MIEININDKVIFEYSYLVSHTNIQKKRLTGIVTEISNNKDNTKKYTVKIEDTNFPDHDNENIPNLNSDKTWDIYYHQIKSVNDKEISEGGARRKSSRKSHKKKTRRNRRKSVRRRH